jgi:hypothetical protein
MTDSDKLQEVIRLAIERGWKQPQELSFTSNKEFLIYLTDSTPSTLRWIKFKLNEILFKHDFAKAFWGEETHIVTGPGINDYVHVKGWKKQLQQAVISDNPIEYYYQNRGEK